MRRKSCVAEKSRHANFAKKALFEGGSRMDHVQKALGQLAYCPFHLQIPLYAYCLDCQVIVWLYVSQPRYYVVCTSHTLEASRMTSEDKKGST